MNKNMIEIDSEKALNKAWENSSIELPVIKDIRTKMSDDKYNELVECFVATVTKSEAIDFIIENDENEDEEGEPIPL